MNIQINTEKGNTMYSLEEKSKKSKGISSAPRHPVHSFGIAPQNAAAPIQRFYFVKNMKRDIRTGNVDTFVSYIQNCSSYKLETVYKKCRNDLIKYQARFNNDQYATIISYLITRNNPRNEFKCAFNNLIALLKIQLNNKSVAANLIDQEVLIIKRNKELTDYKPYKRWKSSSSSGGSGQWSTTRGAGAFRYGTTGPVSPNTFSPGTTPIAYGSAAIMKDGKAPIGAQSFKYTAVAEEDLDPSVPIDPRFQAYDRGYSIGAHEFAHTIHEFGITDAQRVRIGNCYEAFLLKVDSYPSAAWVDGPGPCYASTNVKEYFAQSSNAYLSMNAGKDAATGKTRHNSRRWLEKHDPDLLRVLDEIYRP